MYEPTAVRLNPWTPVVDEHAYPVTRIEGAIPPELHGTLFRNGPSQRVAPVEGYEAMHLFDGDGLVHAFRIADGRVHYTSRFVRDDTYHLDERLGPSKSDFLNFRVADPACCDLRFGIPQKCDPFLLLMANAVAQSLADPHLQQRRM